MPLARAEYFEKILMNLSILRYIFKSNTKRGLYDLNKKSESFFCQLLNNVYDYNLQHLEQYQTNYPAIDLGDIAKKVAIQVTATNSSTKIKSTIKKFVEHNLHKKYDRLIILIITDKKSYTANFSSALEFDPKADIFDIDDILTKVESLDLAKLEAICEFVTNEIGKVLFVNVGENSIFSKIEITPDNPPKSCNAFMEFIDDENKESNEKV